MNWKIVAVGGIAFYVAQFVVGVVTGPLLHEGILQQVYMAHASFWRPELNQTPPDMAALMPRWITTGLIGAFIMTALYTQISAALTGAGWLKGLKFGLGLALVYLSFCAGLSGVFNLPDYIWFWWAIEGFAYFLVGGAALGWVAAKLTAKA